MCGRFTLIADPEEMGEILPDIKVVDWMRPSYNIAPSQNIIAVLNEDDGPQTKALKWGLIPSWSKDSKIGAKLTNARSETVAEKPSFRSAYQKRRCLILSTGFYEWKTEGNQKIPFFIRLTSRRLFPFAGLYEYWTDPEKGETVATVTIITTSANEVMTPIHHRMPVILSPENAAGWISNKGFDGNAWLEKLCPYPSEEMDAYPVSSAVNKPINNSPELIRPQQQIIEEERDLFS